MDSRESTTESTLTIETIGAPLGSDPVTQDGRQLRRLRNIEAVRAAILDLHLERASLDLETVAARAGVTVRSIYRYHADLDAAIDDAFESRERQVYEVWARQTLPSSDEPLDARIATMIDHRMEIERLGRPLRNTIQKVSPDPEFDREVLEVFAPELSRFQDDEFATTTAAVCFMLRPRGLRSVIEFPQHGDVDPRSVIEFSIRRLLTGPSAVDTTPWDHPGPPI